MPMSDTVPKIVPSRFFLIVITSILSCIILEKEEHMEWLNMLMMPIILELVKLTSGLSVGKIQKCI